MVTIRDVARESGLSVTSVSAILNNAPQARQIPARTKVRVKEVVKRLGYHRNLLAGSLRTKRSRTFGVLVFDITDPYCTEILKGIEGALYRYGYVPILMDAQNDRGRFNRAVETLLERRIDGLIAVAVANFLNLGPDPLKPLVERGIPVVSVGRKLATPASSVFTDYEAGTRCALEYLYALGHREIAFIKGPEDLLDTGQRWNGISEYAKAVQLELNPGLVVQINGRNSSYQEGFELTEELLRRQRHFTALMAFDDITAFGAISSLSNTGIHVPRECSVIGFDDIPEAAFYNPPLTTVSQALALQGSLSVEVLVQSVRTMGEKKKLDPVYRTVAPKLVARKTTIAPTR
jgi:LacI family transcriptional regulator